MGKFMAHLYAIERRFHSDGDIIPETIGADRGFCEGFRGAVEKKNFRLVTPAFKRGRSVHGEQMAFSLEDSKKTREQASRRVIIENARSREDDVAAVGGSGIGDGCEDDAV